MEQNRVHAKGNYSITQKISLDDLIINTKHQDFIELTASTSGRGAGGM
jgi:hypothetical protein